MEIYLDNSATTKLDKRVLKEMMPYLIGNYGNPSSKYRIGRENKNVIEKSRKNIAQFFNVESNEIYFTSGGSESNNMALKGVAFAYKNRGRHIITSKIEHHSVLNVCSDLENHGFEISYIDVNKDGIIDLEQLKRTIREDTILISIMFANNEIGTIQPIKEIGQIAEVNNIIFHTDAVQAVGQIDIDIKKMKIHLLSLSAHKIYGPKGVGALYISNDIKICNIINGGGQENNKRAGTENIAGIVGMSKAVELICNDIQNKKIFLSDLKLYFLNELRNNKVNFKVNGDLNKCLPGLVNISFVNLDANIIMLELDKKGIYISTGSACTSGLVESSHVLKSIGLSNIESQSSIRISFGKYNTKEEVDATITEICEIITRLKKISVFNSILY